MTCYNYVIIIVNQINKLLKCRTHVQLANEHAITRAFMNGFPTTLMNQGQGRKNEEKSKREGRKKAKLQALSTLDAFLFSSHAFWFFPQFSSHAFEFFIVLPYKNKVFSFFHFFIVLGYPASPPCCNSSGLWFAAGAPSATYTLTYTTSNIHTFKIWELVECSGPPIPLIIRFML